MFKKRLVAIGAIGLLSLSLVGCENIFDKKKEEETTGVYDKEVEDKIDEINGYIDNYFYFQIDENLQEEAVYDGIMAGLDDPYSVYYTPDELQDLMDEDSGEYVGIGAVVTQLQNKSVSVVRPVPGSPAEEAGIMAEDIIVQVGDVEIVDQDLETVVNMIRGEENTSVFVKVFRPSENKYIEFDITRKLLENATVYTDMLDDNIGYIQVTQFYENTDERFIEEIEKMKSVNVKGIIVDLRDNPGGLLTSVVNMCDYIMDEGVICTTKDKDGKIIGEYTSDAEKSLDIPMVVLTNGNSASASEIFTGAMKDTGKAEIVGTTTFGKGIVQSVIPLSDGSGIKLTIAKYFTPAGNDIHEAGVEPDYVVELPDNAQSAVNINREDDTQLKKAVEIIGTLQ